jgi:hypothetical protein
VRARVPGLTGAPCSVRAAVVEALVDLVLEVLDGEERAGAVADSEALANATCEGGAP